MLSSNSERSRRRISDYFEALHGGLPPVDAQKPAPKPDESAKNTDQTPKPKQP
jgi:hypothetical protein